MRSFRVTYVKEITFEDVWGELESKKCFQRKQLTKYLRLRLRLNFLQLLTNISLLH